MISVRLCFETVLIFRRWKQSGGIERGRGPGETGHSPSIQKETQRKVSDASNPSVTTKSSPWQRVCEFDFEMPGIV
jgi:hypothetical protein